MPLDTVTVVIAASAATVVGVVAALLLLASRSSGHSGEEAPPLAVEAEEIPRIGGGVAPTSGGGAGGWVEELLGEPPLGGGEPRQPLASDAVASRLLFVLEEARALPLEELGLRIGADRELVARAVRELERRGLVRVEGGVVLFSERGEKLITRLREKYFEKKRWLEGI